MKLLKFFYRTGILGLASVALLANVSLVEAQTAPLTKQAKSVVDRNASGDSPADPGPLATDVSAKLAHKDIQAAMRKVADWQLSYAEAKFNQQWTYAALYDGLLAASKDTGEPKYADAVARFAVKSDWQLIDERFPHADDEALGQAYLDLYQAKPEPVKMAATRAVMDRLVARQDDPKRPLWWWCDALFMAPPVLMRMYAITGDRKYIDTMDREWWITYDALYRQQDHLYSRDASYLTKTEKNGKPLYWARGNGWVLAALAKVLELMPADYPTRPKYVAQFKEMSATIASLQTADGLWKTGLLDPDSYPMAEVSGSAFYTYAMAWGINHDLLDAKTFRPVTEKAWAGMVKHIYASGRLGSIQPVGAAPDAFSPSSSYVFGVGGFLMAGAELDRMVSKPRHK
jgi:rhamnogalacturonyl hydrolase YesR